MKKKISGVIIIVAVAAATIWNFNQSKNEMTLSELALANVEALAQGESGEVRYQTMGYCTPSDLTYMCVTRVTAERCRRDCK